MLSFTGFTKHHLGFLLWLLLQQFSFCCGQLNDCSENRCPVAFKLLDNGTCVCINGDGIFCTYSTHTGEEMAYLPIGKCISTNYFHNISECESNGTIIATCPFTLGTEITTPLIQLPRSRENLSMFCQHFKRKGRFCSECNEEHGIDVLSVSFNCVPCTGSAVVNWLKYFTVKLLPSTVFILIIVFFHIGITSAALNGFVFYSQMLTLPWNVAYLESLWRIHLGNNSSASTARLCTQAYIAPLSVWNLNFDSLGYIFSSNGICLGHEIEIIHVLALHYLTAIYPLLVLVVMYVLIKLHSHNCRPLVHLWNVCRICVRFRRQWNMKTTLIDAFATILLLSYTKLVYVSFSLIAENKTDRPVIHHVMADDPSVKLYSSRHIPYAVVAYVVLTFGTLPPVCLFFYPFKFFQKLLNRCRCQSFVQTLHCLAAVFQKGYKNGINGTPDRRYFSGLYFLFRLMIASTLSWEHQGITSQFSFLQYCYVIFIIVFLLSLPHKKHIFNCIDSFLIFILFVVSNRILAVYRHLVAGLRITAYKYQHIDTLIVALTCPYMYVACYLLYLLTTKLRHHKYVATFIKNFPHTPRTPLLILDQQSSSSTSRSPQCSMPDRLENPQRY